MPEELWTEVCDIVQEAIIKAIPKKKKCKKAKWLSEEALQIAAETVSSRAAAILRGGGDAQGAAAPQHRPLLRLLEVRAEGPGLHRAGHRTHDLGHAQDVSSAPAGGSWEDWWWEVATASGLGRLKARVEGDDRR